MPMPSDTPRAVVKATTAALHARSCAAAAPGEDEVPGASAEPVQSWARNLPTPPPAAAAGGGYYSHLQGGARGLRRRSLSSELAPTSESLLSPLTGRASELRSKSAEGLSLGGLGGSRSEVLMASRALSHSEDIGAALREGCHQGWANRAGFGAGDGRSGTPAAYANEAAFTRTCSAPQQFQLLPTPQRDEVQIGTTSASWTELEEAMDAAAATAAERPLRLGSPLCRRQSTTALPNVFKPSGQRPLSAARVVPGAACRPGGSIKGMRRHSLE